MSKARQLAELGNVYDDGALGNRNLIINGAMQVAQRGASLSVTSSGGYSLDRFYVQSNVGSGHTWAQVQETPSGEGFNYSAKLTVGTGATPVSDNFGRVIYYVEGYDSQALNWGNTSPKAATFSFWVKSSVTGSFGGCFKLQKESPFPGFYYTYTISLANTWEYKTVTVPAGVFVDGNMDSTNGIGVLVAFDLGEGPDRSTTTGYNSSNNGGALGVTGADKILATSGATWQITGVQLEVGDTATPFEHRSYGQELALCQRYFFKTYSSGVSPATLTVTGSFGDTATGQLYRPMPYKSFPVEMRAVPTITLYSPSTGASGKLRDDNAGADLSALAYQTGTNGTRCYPSATPSLGNDILGHLTAEAEL